MGTKGPLGEDVTKVCFWHYFEKIPGGRKHFKFVTQDTAVMTISLSHLHTYFIRQNYLNVTTHQRLNTFPTNKKTLHL